MERQGVMEDTDVVLYFKLHKINEFLGHTGLKTLMFKILIWTLARINV